MQKLYGKIGLWLISLILTVNPFFTQAVLAQSDVIMINNCVELQNMNADLSASYQLANDIDCSDTVNWNNEKGFEPIGYMPNMLQQWIMFWNESEPFTGHLDGNGHTISNLYIYRPSDDFIGLFGYTQGAELENFGLKNIKIAGKIGTGGVIGINSNGTISNIHSTGSITGQSNVGGLVGLNDLGNPYSSSYFSISYISKSYTSSTVTGQEGGYGIGGLIGVNFSGHITYSHANGDTQGDDAVGGLVGYQGNYGSVNNSYSSANVIGNSSVGGLVGSNDGWGGSFITNSFSTGDVTGQGDEASGNIIGGLVGYNISSGMISNSYSTSDVAGNMYVGGLVGINQYSSTISNSYSNGNVEGASIVGGLVGDNNTSSTIVYSYWDIVSSGKNNMCGAQIENGFGCDDLYGKTTKHMKYQTTFQNWDFNSTWGIHNNISYPWLEWQYSTEGLDITGDDSINQDDFACAVQIIHYKNASLGTPSCLSPNFSPEIVDYNCDGIYTYGDITVMKTRAYKRPLSVSLDVDNNFVVDACES